MTKQATTTPATGHTPEQIIRTQREALAAVLPIAECELQQREDVARHGDGPDDTETWLEDTRRAVDDATAALALPDPAAAIQQARETLASCLHQISTDADLDNVTRPDKYESLDQMLRAALAALGENGGA